MRTNGIPVPVIRRALARAALLTAMAVTIGACGGGSDGGSDAAGDTTPTEATSPDTTAIDTVAETTSTTAGESESFPCSLIPQADVEEIAGNPLDEGWASVSQVTENTASWSASVCAWTGPTGSDSTEITLSVSRADDFPSAAVECPEIPGTSTPVLGLGNSAQWSWVDAGTTTTVGELRVCTDDALVHVRIAGAGSGDEQLAIAREAAERSIAALI